MWPSRSALGGRMSSWSAWLVTSEPSVRQPLGPRPSSAAALVGPCGCSGLRPLRRGQAASTRSPRGARAACWSPRRTVRAVPPGSTTARRTMLPLQRGQAKAATAKTWVGPERCRLAGSSVQREHRGPEQCGLAVEARALPVARAVPPLATQRGAGEVPADPLEPPAVRVPTLCGVAGRARPAEVAGHRRRPRTTALARPHGPPHSYLLPGWSAHHDHSLHRLPGEGPRHSL